MACKCLEMEEPRESFTWSGRASRISFKAEAPSEASEREANDRTPSDFGDEDRFAEKQVRGGGGGGRSHDHSTQDSYI